MGLLTVKTPYDAGGRAGSAIEQGAPPTLPVGSGSAAAGATGAEAIQAAVESALAAVGLVVASPVMLVVAIIIRLDSPGPALFRQTRVGKDFRPFTFYKFRTLLANARELYPELYAYKFTPEEIDALCFKREEDPRVTRVGRWLRKSTLDELPNLWNVLKGEMALVGPRPDIPEMQPYYRPDQKIKFSVKPGVTGLAQTSGRGRLRFQETIARDIEYVKNKSVRLDIRLILRTLKLLITRDGAF